MKKSDSRTLEIFLLAVVVVLSIFTVVPFERLYSIHLSADNDATLTFFVRNS